MNLFTNCRKHLHLLLFTALILMLSGCEDTGQESNEPVTQYHKCPLSQQAGTNVPEVHEVDLFVTPPGAFNFSYNTYSAEDRIIVTYEGKLLLDTGCVGEMKNKLITLPTNPKSSKEEGVSSKIVVRVEPDCVGGKKDTEWLFTVDCPKCDFGSSDSEPERCFGGVGSRCKDDVVVPPHIDINRAPKTYDYVNCTIEGFMSVGSILHDDCCIHNPKGYSCQEVNSNNSGYPDNLAPCKGEWEEAWNNTSMCKTVFSKSPSERQWKVTFGPYYYGNKGDFLDKNHAFFVGKQSLRVPAGQRVDPKYQHLCDGGKCAFGGFFDSCGLYCFCE